MNQNRNPPKSSEIRQKLTRRQTKALAALLECKSVAEAARRCGCAESTLFVYLKNPIFVGEYEAAQDRLLDDAAARVKRGLAPALDVLQEISEDATQPPASRVAAARGTVEAGLKLLREHETRKKIDELGETLKQLQEGR